MLSGLRRRLMAMLLTPLLLLALLSAWLDYRSAGNAAVRQDSQLVQMVPLLGDSIIAPGGEPGDPPVLLLAPPFEEFLQERAGLAAWAISDVGAGLLHGDDWLVGSPPATPEPQFHSEEHEGVTYRIVVQRVNTAAGDLVLALADGSDPRQQWLRTVLYKVMAPNLVLLVAAAFAINWAVRQALRPLIQIKEAVERRSPRDLSPMDVLASPEEVRPLVRSLNRLFALVEAQAESQRRFVADAAHQLRTPLAGLQAQVEAWAQTAGDPKIDLLRDATRRTSQLASQLLALSRADAGLMAGEPMQPVELKALCESILQEHLDAASAKSIDLGLDAAAVHAVGHAWLLRELLGNLVDNALKYTPAGGTVTIRCGLASPRRPGDASQPFLEVEDDGPGLARDERERVLARFYRVPGSPGEGNGLGLAIVDEIARMHGSHVELQPAGPDGGLRATVRLAA
ncbi:MAG: ATP-binding protein [Burkholderiaceae bacterium]|nr:ATP-binding protein [Burkholderiaceae bacterium]MDO9090624.1 ATP-binding protein [Burkholderiaceae bacterium]MDP1967862.1 ATP-binding protein [Burkholderiaceae bacterium]